MARQFTILVVDDEEAIREIAGAVLSSAGYQVRTAASGTEALCVLADETVDLLFTDIRMPGMSGYDLARHALRLQPSLRVLYTTGFSGRMQRSTIAADADTLSKPWRAHDLVSKIDSALVASITG